jgi:DNA-binding FadR family transcriptional regulator
VSLAGQRIRVSRVADQVSARIRDLILTGELSDGDRLPSVEVLMRDFGVSGPSVREALRILESEGLITVRRGSAGGCIVRRPDPRAAAYLVALVLSSLGTTMDDVLAATAMLEPACAMLCARRPDRADTVVPRLRALNAAASRSMDGDYAEFARHVMAFHETLVRQCGSATITVLVGILETIWFATARELAANPAAHRDDHGEKAELVRGHERICDLIEAGEDYQAHKMMTEHIQVHRVHARRVYPGELVNAAAIHDSRD